MIKVCIKGQIITDFSTPDIVANSIDYITAAFNFHSPEWEGLTKYAHFLNGDEPFDIELIDDVISADKHLNFTAGEWTIWLSGHLIENGELKQRITTDMRVFSVKGTGTTDTGNPFPSAVPSITEQILAEIGDVEQLETADKQTLVDAINEVFRTAGGEISPELIAAAVISYFEKNPIKVITDHSELIGRDKENQHSIGSVSGLQTALDGKQPKGDYASKDEIPKLTGFATEDYVKDYSQPKGDYLKNDDISDWAKADKPPVCNADTVGADAKGTAASKVSEHNVSEDSHNDIRLLIDALSREFHALADSDDIDLNQLSEIIAAIKENRGLLDAVTTSKVNYSDIINNLVTNVADKPLSAAQGVILKGLIDAITIPTKLSDLAEDETHRTVTDEEKNAWNAKSTFDGKYQSLEGAPEIPTVPSVVSSFENDAGYVSIKNNTFGNGDTINIAEGYSEWRTADAISALVFSYPEGIYEAWVEFTTAASGAVTVVFPAGTKYINGAPVFGNSETWEISVKDGIAVAAKTA